MKKILLLLCMTLIFCLVACGSSEAEETTATAAPTETAAPTASSKDACDDQVETLVSCRGMWIRSNPEAYYNYAVTDLDQNGRLELIVSVCQGPGKFSTTEVWEVNESKDGIYLCTMSDPSWPSMVDFGMDSAKCFFDGETYTYIFEDTTFGATDGFATDKRTYVLKDGIITENSLCSVDTSGGKDVCFSNGQEITKDDYDNMEDNVYAGQLPLTAKFLWQAPFHDEIDVLTKEDWHGMLADSWQKFQLN